MKKPAAEKSENAAGFAYGQTIHLPWPPRTLSPNVQGHWAKKASAKKAYRSACRRAGEQGSGVGGFLPPDALLRVSLRFCPPDVRRRDLDNLLAAMKSGLDGIADAIGIDDSRFRIAVDWAGPITGGMVLV